MPSRSIKEPLDPEAQVRIEGLKEQVLKLQATLRRRCAEADGQAGSADGR